jgi:hypothetical protein
MEHRCHNVDVYSGAGITIVYVYTFADKLSWAGRPECSMQQIEPCHGRGMVELHSESSAHSEAEIESCMRACLCYRDQALAGLRCPCLYMLRCQEGPNA